MGLGWSNLCLGIFHRNPDEAQGVRDGGPVRRGPHRGLPSRKIHKAKVRAGCRRPNALGTTSRGDIWRRVTTTLKSDTLTIRPEDGPGLPRMNQKPLC
jgi:hypothetical protein